MPRDAFLFYVDDWLSSGRIELMDAIEERGYLRLLLRAWKQADCGLPVDDLILAAWSKMGQQWFQETADPSLRIANKTSGQKVLECFLKRDGRLFNEKQLAEREYQERINEARKANGQKGGRPRKKEPDGKPNGNLNETGRFSENNHMGNLEKTNLVSGSVLVTTVSVTDKTSGKEESSMRREFDEQWLEFEKAAREFWPDLIPEDLSVMWYGFRVLDFEQKATALEILRERINASQDSRYVTKKYFDKGEWKRKPLKPAANSTSERATEHRNRAVNFSEVFRSKK